MFNVLIIILPLPTPPFLPPPFFPHLTGPMQQSLGHHVVNAVNFGGKMGPHKTGKSIKIYPNIERSNK